MGTLRQDSTTDQWVILAPERGVRPLPPARVRPAVPPHDAACPFCPGNEERTPPEIARHPAPGGWGVRVVPNRYPAVSTNGGTERWADAPSEERDGLGAHEVVVESPLHDQRIDDMSVDHVAAVVATWRDRSRTLAAAPWAKAVVVFKNFGVRAGTSLEHPHSQIMAVPVIPPEAIHLLDVADRYHGETGRSVYLDLLDRELVAGTRVVAERDGFLAVAPFASRLPYETWILPRSPAASFAALRDDQVPDVADLVREVIGELRVAADDPDYNLVVHTAPVGEEANPAFQWHLRVLPRMVTSAGFELGSGMSINCVAPEDAAGALRRARARVPAH
jgi:UDPglucose--hexose-1-phosphate uridylyltransferase